MNIIIVSKNCTGPHKEFAEATGQSPSPGSSRLRDSFSASLSLLSSISQRRALMGMSTGWLAAVEFIHRSQCSGVGRLSEGGEAGGCGGECREGVQ